MECYILNRYSIGDSWNVISLINELGILDRIIECFQKKLEQQLQYCTPVLFSFAIIFLRKTGLVQNKEQ